MAQSARFVGIDVAARRLEVYSHPDGATCAVDNTPAGWQALVAWLGTEPVAGISVEATGGYETGVVRHLAAAGFTVRRLDPAQVKALARVLRQRAKSDRLDAALIARAGLIADTPAYDPRPEVERLSELIKYRQQALADRIALDNQARTLTDPDLLDWTRRRREQLAALLTWLEQEIAAASAAPPLAERAALLGSAPGVGPILAGTLLALLPELGHLSGRQIAALVGVAPYDRRSGQSDAPRHIAGGRPTVRSVLYMATLSAVRCNPILRTFYQRLCRAGKKPKVALVAAMRKLIVALNAMLKQGQPWRPQTALTADP